MSRKDNTEPTELKTVEVNQQPMLPVRNLARKPFAAMAIQGFVDSYKNHPAVSTWYLFDEPNNTSLMSPERMKIAYDAVKARDPSKPISVVFSHILQADEDPEKRGNPVDPGYWSQLDNLMYDFYPIIKDTAEFKSPKLPYFHPWLSVARRRAQEYGKKFYQVVQAYGTTEEGVSQFGKRDPTPKEFAYLVYTALVNRSEGLFFWSYPRSKESWLASTYRPVMRRVSGLLRLLPDSSNANVMSILSTNNNALSIRQIYSPAQNRYYFLITNPSRYPTDATLQTTLSDTYRTLSELDLFIEDGTSPIDKELNLQAGETVNTRKFAIEMQAYEVKLLMSVFR